MKIDDFIGILFLSRSVTHKLHLESKKYSEHIALGDFYTSIADLTDSFVEQYQGRFQKLIDIPIATMKTIGDPLEYLTDVSDWIRENRYKVCDKEESTLQNQIDEILSLFYSTIYKLKFLK